MIFLLTHIEKSCEKRAEERRLLTETGCFSDTSADDITSADDTEPEQPPFQKDRLKAMIERGGGLILDEYDEEVQMLTMLGFGYWIKKIIFYVLRNACSSWGKKGFICGFLSDAGQQGVQL